MVMLRSPMQTPMAFYRDHKGDAQYAQRAGRDIEYIRIPLTASFDDRQNAPVRNDRAQRHLGHGR